MLDAVNSILGQTFREFEFIIIDDGSKDSTLKILENIADPRLRLLKNPANIGLVATLNRGLKEAHGRYLVRMDADDISLPERIFQQVDYLEKHPEIDVLGSMVELIDEHGKRFSSIAYPTDPATIREMLYQECCLVHPTVVFRTNVVRQAGGYSASARNTEDYELWLRLSDNHLIANLPVKLLKYRVHSGQVSITNLAVQYKLIQEFRHATLIRREIAGEQISKSTRNIIYPSLLHRLSAYPCTLGADYITWSKQYFLLNKPPIAFAFALSAIKHSPLSFDAWKNLFVDGFVALTPPSWRRAFLWYIKRTRSIFTNNRHTK